MTLYQFKVLELNEQAQATWELGEHVAVRMTATYKILLWVVEDFYVEMFYNYIDNKIEKIRSYRNPELLRPYLSQIDISSAFY
jgi:hypothetical protein